MTRVDFFSRDCKITIKDPSSGQYFFKRARLRRPNKSYAVIVLPLGNNVLIKGREMAKIDDDDDLNRICGHGRNAWRKSVHGTVKKKKPRGATEKKTRFHAMYILYIHNNR